ncbi:unnamed protein product [Paramecium sonneborni]|uniref:Uncharacterized protein n=1 Tax=Paramecium sonneborni TaxID=65129 RepID=A0A8S1LPV8_9CILI|nr:unnamed protein product [Paramecium sonneborni]
MIDYKLLTEFEEQKTQFLERFIQTKSNKQQIYDKKDSKTELIMRKLEKERLQTPFVCYQFRVKKLRTFDKRNSYNSNSFINNQRSQFKEQTHYENKKRNNSSYDFTQHINRMELNVQTKEIDTLFRPMQERRQKTPLKMKLQSLEYGKNYQKLVDKIIDLDKNPINFKKNLYI